MLKSQCFGMQGPKRGVIIREESAYEAHAWKTKRA